MSIIDDLGLTEEQLKEGESTTIVKEFEPIPSSARLGTVKGVHVYENQWGGKQMKYVVEVKDDSGEARLVSFRQDIGKELKDKSANKGYAGRLKQFAHATGTNINDVSTGSEEMIKVYGKEIKATTIVGFSEKPVIALVRFTNDTTKEEGAKFKYSNDLQGVVAVDGTEEGGENAADKFKEACLKTPIFTVASKKKESTSNTSATTTASGDSVDSML